MILDQQKIVLIYLMIINRGTHQGNTIDQLLIIKYGYGFYMATPIYKGSFLGICYLGSPSSNTINLDIGPPGPWTLLLPIHGYTIPLIIKLLSEIKVPYGNL